MSKAGAGLVSPMGFTFDPDESLLNNAVRAWEIERENRRMQAEQNARVLARRVFRTDEIEFEYKPLYPTIPTFVVEEELIVFDAHERRFALVEFCSDCGKRWKLYSFNSLAGLGAQVAQRNEETAYQCQECRMIEAMGSRKK